MAAGAAIGATLQGGSWLCGKVLDGLGLGGAGAEQAGGGGAPSGSEFRNPEARPSNGHNDKELMYQFVMGIEKTTVVWALE